MTNKKSPRILQFGNRPVKGTGDVDELDITHYTLDLIMSKPTYSFLSLFFFVVDVVTDSVSGGWGIDRSWRVFMVS